jgi:hypothetical protein
MAELDVELRRVQRTFGYGLGGVRRLQGLAALVDDLFGNSAGLDQAQAAIEVALGKLSLGTRIRKLAVGLLGDGFEGTGIDQIEQVPGMHHVAVLELDIGDEAAHAGANLNFLDRLEASGEFIPIGHGAFDWLRDGDGRRRRGRLWWRFVAAAGQRHGDQDPERPKAAE